MEKELINFIIENNLSPFNKLKTNLKPLQKSIFKTRDAKAIYSKVLSSISSNFVFSDTSNLFLNFNFTNDKSEIILRQEFFKNLPKAFEKDFFKKLELKRSSWKPPYDIIVVTEDEDTYSKLQNLKCPTKLLFNDQSVMELESSEIVQVINCDAFSYALERLPQSVFLNDTSEAYLERYIEILSKYEDIILTLKEYSFDNETNNVIFEIYNLLPLLKEKNVDKITREIVEEALDKIKSELSNKVKELVVSGDSLIDVFNKGIIPVELKKIVKDAILKTNLPEELFLQTIPVQIDEQELEKILRSQSLNKFTSIAENITLHSKELISLPEKIRNLESRILLYDFYSGVSKWMENKKNFPEISNDFLLEESNNLFLTNPQSLNFNLTDEYRCSILTGANSGGKTTLLEHVLQVLSCLQLGLPFFGKAKSPLFSEVYYFAKNKGSIDKGAFETLLNQMSEIKFGEKTLILADEIESVTEPGVAGKMIGATASYFARKGCFLIIATHLGHEINKNIPEFTRIDGIEATGLDENNELIVNHNPVLGKLAHSTPELIIEKMVKTQGGEYFEFLYNNIKKV